MRLSIIIPAYNALADVLRCLNTLHATRHTDTDTDAEFLVQDDASPLYDLRDLIPPALANVERNAKNLGFAGNANAGAKRASGEALLFCNQDVYAGPEISAGWDAVLLHAFDDPQVGIAAPRLLFPDGRVQSVGGGFDARGQPFHTCLGWANPGHPQASRRRAVGWVTGAALAIRRDLFEQIGGFDTGYAGGYFEDVDLCCAARKLGYTVLIDPAATLVHTVGSSGGNPAGFRQNALRFKARWVDTESAFVKPDVPAVMARYW